MNGQIAAALKPESVSKALLQMHPSFRKAELEEEMIAFVSEHLAAFGTDGQRRLLASADENDRLRQHILTRLGYSERGRSEHQWRGDLIARVTCGRELRPRARRKQEITEKRVVG